MEGWNAMQQQDWTRVEGMIIGRDLDPKIVAERLRERAILAQLEWFPASPHLLGLNVAVQDDHVALLRDGTIDVGPTTAEVADDLAEIFDAEVRIGASSADHLPEDESPFADSWEDEDDLDDAPSRIVEIGRTPASSVPLLAALEGIDLASVDLVDGHRALLAELPTDKAGWNFGELPLVTLSRANEEFQIFLVTDDHLEHVITHNWGLSSLIVAGAHEDASEVADDLIDLVGDRPDLRAIAAQVPGANAQALIDSTRYAGDDAVRQAVTALGLPVSVAGFLLGKIDAEEVEGASVHYARGISNAIGRSVDIMLNEPDSPAKPLWNSYQNIAVEKPWIVNTLASIEAIAGTALLTLCVRGEKPRSGWLRVGGILGGFLIIDSIAELALRKYIAQRHERP